jgi:superfamily II DNA or RNA helicase
LDLEKNKIAKQIETKRKELDSVANRGTISKKDAIIELSKFKEHLNKLRKSDKQITIEANENIINQSKKSKKISDLLETFEFVIAEEAHESSGNDYFTVMQCCKNAYWRLALTATPFMKDDEESNMRLMAGSGPIAIKVSEKQLIDSEILAKPYFKFIDNPQPAGVSRATNWRVAYDKGIVENQIRNRLIVLESLQAKKFNVPNLILVQRKEHGKKLQEELEKEGLKSLFIFGETEKVDRENALDKLSAGEIDTLIGSTILDVGVDVPAIGQIILAGGGKAEVNLRQRIGRGLRAKKEKANITFVIDFKDRFNKYLCTHSETRKQIIEATPGFCENIVPFFDYEKLLKI